MPIILILQRKYANLLSGALVTKPEVHLLSSWNENQTTKLNLIQMGENLGKEIAAFVKDKPVSSISFVCHSLGGLIARSCLGGPLGLIERMPNIALNSFISFSSPHLGLGISNNVLFDSGLSVLKYWADCPVLHELLMEDGNIKALQNLPLLNRFSKIRVLGCKQDGYCPIESAVLQFETSSSSDASLRIDAMKTNLLKSIRNSRNVSFRAVEVTFNQSNEIGWSLNSLIDSVIGRAAHIYMLEDHKLSDGLILSNYL